MYLLAVSKLSKERVRIKHGLRYFTEIQRLVTIANTHTKKKDSNLLIQRPIRNMLYIVVTPNQGFCGGLPSVLNCLAVFSAEEQQSHIAKETGGIPPTVGYFTVGKKGHDYFSRTNRPLLKEFAYTEPIWSLAMEITQIVVELFQKEEIDAVFLVYAQSESMTPKPIVEKLLPINLSMITEQVSTRIATDVDTGGGEKGNVVVKYGQKVLERQKIPWSPPLSIVPTAEAKRSCETVVLPMGSRNIDGRTASGKAVNIRRHMLTQKNVGKKSCEPMKREAAYAVLNELLEYPVPQSLVG